MRWGWSGDRMCQAEKTRAKTQRQEHTWCVGRRGGPEAPGLWACGRRVREAGRAMPRGSGFIPGASESLWGGVRQRSHTFKKNTLSLTTPLHYFHQLHYIHLYFKIFFLLFPWDVILKFRDKIEKMEKDVYAVLQLEAEEKEMQKSEAQVSCLVSRPRRPLLVCRLLGCVCQTYHQSPRHLQAVASCSHRVLCYQMWVSSFCCSHRSTQHSGSWRKGRRHQTLSLRGAGSRPRKRGRRKKVCWGGSSKS